MMKDPLKRKSKAHIRYKLADGTPIPGATTITGLLNKPFLITWANRLGLEGIDSTKYRDEAAVIGTIAHEMIQMHLQGQEFDETPYTADQISLAQNACISFFEWEKNHRVEPILLEVPLVSEKHKFGGTIDCYCLLDGVPTLLDFKTGKAIYNDYFVQVAGAYKTLLEEHGHAVKECRILRVGRDETEGFEDRKIDNASKYFKVFKHLLGIYYLKKELKWN
jgi:hypothetical protein